MAQKVGWLTHDGVGRLGRYKSAASGRCVMLCVPTASATPSGTTKRGIYPPEVGYLPPPEVVAVYYLFQFSNSGAARVFAERLAVNIRRVAIIFSDNKVKVIDSETAQRNKIIELAKLCNAISQKIVE
jgi:hypothetical protein